MQHEMLAVVNGGDIDIQQFYQSLSEQTKNHSRHVASLTGLLLRWARQADLYTEEELPIPLIDIPRAVTYHDIGMVLIPDRLLLKTEELTSAEVRVIRKHTHYGCKILDRYLGKHAYIGEEKNFWLTAAEIALSHHERWDGRGYPYGLLATANALAARATAVVDSYDSIVSGAPFRIALPHEYAMLEIYDNAGTQFDPLLVDLLSRHQEEFAREAKRCRSFDSQGSQ